MTIARNIVGSVLALCAACGPKGGAESASGESAGEMGAPDTGSEATGTDGSDATSDEPTGAPGSTSAAPEPTTGDGTVCPGGQVHLAPLWQAEFMAPAMSFGFSSGDGPIGRMADGRIVVAMGLTVTEEHKGLSLLLASPEGEILGPTEQALGIENAEPYALRIGADDQPIVLGAHGLNGGPSVLRLTRFASDMGLLSELELAFPAVGGVARPLMVLAGDAPVVAGQGAMPGEMHVAKLVPDTGAPQWKVALDGPADMWVREIAVGPAGDVAVAAHGDFGIDADDTLRLWRFDADGGKIWERVITVPAYEDITALHFAPDEQIVVLRGTEEFSTRAELLAVEVDSGATRWELTVAEPEGEMTAWAQDMLVDGDGFTIPVTRSKAHHGIETSTHSLEVREVSLQGELLAVTQLSGVFPAGASTSWVRSLRGRCDELIVVQESATLRIHAFAP